MSEIEKMYENADADKICDTFKHWINCEWKTRQCEDCERFVYPPFTAEKQLELIKLLQRKNGYNFSFSSTNDNSEYLFFARKDNTPVQELIVAGDRCYEEALAGFINTLWQFLTEAEKEQIREILK